MVITQASLPRVSPNFLTGAVTPVSSYREPCREDSLNIPGLEMTSLPEWGQKTPWVVWSELEASSKDQEACQTFRHGTQEGPQCL